MPSALATVNIFPGAAVAQSKDSVSLAGGSLLATHIAQTGAPSRGVVTMTSSGVITLNDWTLATGGRTLQTGLTYFVAVGGKISTSGTQPIGIATSPVTLAVSVQSQTASVSSTATNTSALAVEIAALQTQINNLAATITKMFSGSASIASGVNSGSVTGLGITQFIPSRVVPVVRAPAGALNIFATVVDATLTSDGFQYVLSSVTDSANYKLDFIVTP